VPPGLGEIVTMMRVHAELLSQTFGEDLGVRQFRKHAGWYLTGFPVGSAVRRSLGLASSLGELHRLLDGLDGTLAFPSGALRLARGHTNGPRPVRLPAGWLDGVDDPEPPAGGDILVSGG
jgi:Dihydrouridine synthase (Dus)